MMRSRQGIACALLLLSLAFGCQQPHAPVADSTPCNALPKTEKLTDDELAQSAAELLAQGQNALQVGDCERAVLLLQSAIQKAKANQSLPQNLSLIVNATLALSSAFTLENQSHDAILPLNEALRIKEIIGPPREQLRLALVDCLLRAGHTKLAQEKLAEPISAELPDGVLLKAMLDARIKLQTRDADEITDAVAELISLQGGAAQSPIVFPDFLILLTITQGEAHQIAEARATLRTLAAQLEIQPPSPQGLRYAIAALRLLAGLGDNAGEELAALLTGVALRQLGPQGAPKMASLVYGYLGQIAERQQHTDDALTWTRKALLPAGASLDPGLAMLWNWQLARLMEAQGDYQKADARFTAALSLANDRQFADFYPLELPSFFDHERPQDLFRDAADFLLLHGASVRSSPESAWREALDVMNSRRELRVRDFLQDQCLAALQNREKSVASIDPGSAVLHILVLPGRTEVLLQVNNQLLRNVVPVPQEEVLQVTEDFRAALTNRLSTRYRQPAQQLYDWLIRPFEKQLEDGHVETLVVATDGAMQLVPFAALYDGKNFLIQKMAVVSTPSLRLLDANVTRPREALVLGLGLTQAVQGYPLLVSAKQELDDLRFGSHYRFIEDEGFTEQNFRQAILDEKFSIVHVVSHAEVGADPDDFFILTHDGRIGLDDLDRDIRPTLYRKQPLELLILSACSTASGDDRVALGLAGVALKAGARSTIASLWSVNDQSSGDFFAAFYKRWLSPGAPGKAQSMRAAQLSLLQDARYRHPALWAPYILIGNWR